MRPSSLLLRVERVQSGSTVAPGLSFRLEPGADVVLGRDPGCALFLDDAHVSRRHARCRVRDGVLWIAPLGERTTLVNEAPVLAPSALRPGDWLQVGGVLLRVHQAAADTTAAEAPAMPIGTLAHANPVLLLSGSGIAFFGHQLRLKPAARTTLESLARRPGRWLDGESLAEAIWPGERYHAPYVGKNVSYVRAALREVVAAEPDVAAGVRELVVAHADIWTSLTDLGSRSTDALLREFIKARKKTGYRIHLGPEDVAAGPQSS